MVDLSDKEFWFTKGTAKSAAYEYIKDYELTDEETDFLYFCICSIIIECLFESFNIKEDPEQYARMLYHGETAMVGYIASEDPELFNSKIFKLSLLMKDRSIVVEDYFYETLLSRKAEKYSYELYKDFLRDIYVDIVTNKDDLVKAVHKKFVK